MKFSIVKYLINLGVNLRKYKKNEVLHTMIGEVSKAKIAEWKKQYGDNVFVYVSNDFRIGYFVSPTLVILDRCEVNSRGSKQKFNKLLVESCWLGGDETLKTSEEHLLGIYKWLPSLITITEGILAKI